MKEKLFNYISIAVLFIQVLLLGYLSIYFFWNDSINNYSKIVISGNKLLDEEEYLQLVDFDEATEKNSLNLIKTQIETHPYVVNADVSVKEKNIIEIKIEEKVLYSTIIKDYQTYFITNNFELIEILPGTNIPALPHLVLNEKYGYLTDEIKFAFKIIDSFRELNNELLEKLIEINLSGNKDLVLLFKNLNAQVLINKSNLLKEIVIFCEFMNSDKSKILNVGTRYIDMRFNNQIIIG